MLCFDIFNASWMEILSEVQMHQTSVKGVWTLYVDAVTVRFKRKTSNLLERSAVVCKACAINCIARLVNSLVRFKRSCASRKGN
jgi:hypothetical protein